LEIENEEEKKGEPGKQLSVISYQLSVISYQILDFG
jgi:hypothetical protein